MDDASTDGTWDILQRLAREDGRMRIFRNSSNVGPYVSKNIALDMAEGEFVAGHDADDWAFPDRIYEQNRVFLRDSAARVCMGYMIRLFPDGKPGVLAFPTDASPYECHEEAVVNKENLNIVINHYYPDRQN